MRRFIFAFTVTSIFAILPLVAQDRGLQVLATSVAGPEYRVGKQYAVLIGIDRYAEWGSLRNPVKQVPTSGVSERVPDESEFARQFSTSPNLAAR